MIENSRPRLMFVLGLAPVKIGGMEKFLRLFTQNVDRRGYDTVLCFDGPVADVFRASVDFPFCTIESVDHQGDLGFSAAGALWRVLRKHRPQQFIYVFHGVMRCFPWLAKLSGARGITFFDQSSRPPEFQAKPLALPKRIVGRILTLPLDLIVSVTEFTQRTGISLGLTSAPGVVVFNGVELPQPAPERGRALRERLGIAQDAIVIEQLCWMVPVKGVQTLLDAAPEVLAAVPSAHFLLVGDGPQIGEYRARAAKLGLEGRVTFTGVISNPTENGVFEAADIYCQPSLWQEASGMAVMEAMSFTLPPVVSRIGGLPELVHDDVNGFLFNPGDPQSLAGRLISLAQSPELRRTMGSAAHADIVEHHQLHAIVDQFADAVLKTACR